MNLKVGDTVQLMKGKEAAQLRGTGKPAPRGKITEILEEKGRVRVEGLRTVTKHVRRGRDPKNPDGGKIEALGTIALSNVQLICPNCSKPTRVGRKLAGEGDKARSARYCKKCEQLIDKK